MYELLYDSTTEKSNIELPYTLDNFKIPLKITENHINILLKKQNSDEPPEHMYM